jgi:hypothetical protein
MLGQLMLPAAPSFTGPYPVGVAVTLRVSASATVAPTGPGSEVVSIVAVVPEPFVTPGTVKYTAVPPVTLLEPLTSYVIVFEEIDSQYIWSVTAEFTTCSVTDGWPLHDVPAVKLDPVGAENAISVKPLPNVPFPDAKFVARKSCTITGLVVVNRAV